MIGEMEANIQEESRRILLDWLDVCESVALDDYIAEHASPEFLKWHNEEMAHLEEMERQGILV